LGRTSFWSKSGKLGRGGPGGDQAYLSKKKTRGETVFVIEFWGGACSQEESDRKTLLHGTKSDASKSWGGEASAGTDSGESTDQSSCEKQRHVVQKEKTTKKVKSSSLLKTVGKTRKGKLIKRTGAI